MEAEADIYEIDSGNLIDHRLMKNYIFYNSNSNPWGEKPYIGITLNIDNNFRVRKIHINKSKLNEFMKKIFKYENNYNRNKIKYFIH